MTREEALQYGHLMFSLEEDKESAMCDFITTAIKALEQEPCDDMGEVSDGYHTFNQLYHQRAVLFATIVNQNKDKSWKSFKHSDGKYCFDRNGEWFIVGIDTPQGSYTYHYAKEYWDIFDCEELECGKEWDGHTEEDVTRLLSLEQEPCDDAISRQAAIDACLNGWNKDYKEIVEEIRALPPVKPQYTDAEIQKMQDLEFAEIQKAYEIGKAENPNRWGSVIEDIKSEINELSELDHIEPTYEDCKGDVLKILDKYKASPTGAESEVQDADCD